MTFASPPFERGCPECLSGDVCVYPLYVAGLHIRGHRVFCRRCRHILDALQDPRDSPLVSCDAVIAAWNDRPMSPRLLGNGPRLPRPPMWDVPPLVDPNILAQVCIRKHGHEPAAFMAAWSLSAEILRDFCEHMTGESAWWLARIVGWTPQFWLDRRGTRTPGVMFGRVRASRYNRPRRKFTR